MYRSVFAKILKAVTLCVNIYKHFFMLSRLVKYWAKNILRNTFLSASSILILTLLMFFINILLVLHDVSLRIIDGVNEKLTISLYLDEQYDKNSVEIIDLQNDIKRTIPEVSIVYKTKDEVLEELRETDPELVGILERQNPLPETISISDIPLKSYENLNSIIESKLYVLTENVQEESLRNNENFSTYTRQFERIDRVTSVLNILQIGLYVIIITFVISIAIIVYSIIWNFIYYYKDEIYITRLVWGSKLFIYGPFSLQWMMYVGISFIISSSLFLILLSNLRFVFELSEFSDVYTWNLPLVLFIQAIVFLIVGAGSWFLSSRRYLKK